MEKRLRNLVNVPSPVRSDQAGVSTTGGQLTTISSAPSAVENLDGVTQDSRRLADSLTVVKAVPSRSSSKPASSMQDDALTSLTTGNAKIDSPREPARPQPKELITKVMASDMQRPARNVPQPNNSARLLSNTKLTETESKSASLLKLVGGSDKLGKSKEELVDEYKRARRAELEAMLRTMVLK